MKKVSILFVMCILALFLTGCTSNEKNSEKTPSRVKEVTGEIKKAELNENNDIVIKESDITDEAAYINYEYEGVTIGLLAVKDSKGNTKVVVNTCQSCGGSPYAYFVQVGNMIQCQNCGSTFAIDNLDKLIEDGCNPIPIENKEVKDGVITIGVEQLKILKNKFENWEGPKA